MAQWKFPPSGGGQTDGFNNGAMDHFKGYRLSSFVREIIQNSLDAKKNVNEPVKVVFEINVSCHKTP